MNEAFNAVITRHIDEVHQWGLIHAPFGYKPSALTICPFRPERANGTSGNKIK